MKYTYSDPWSGTPSLPTSMEEIHRQAVERTRYRQPRRRVVIGPHEWELSSS